MPLTLTGALIGAKRADQMARRTQYKALCAAVAGGDADALREAAASDPEAARHWKPIMDAAFAGRADMIGVLLDAGADPNAIAGTPGRHSPLVRAMQPHTTIPKHAGHEAAVDVLLARGADPDLAAGPHGMPPLLYAAMGGFDGFVHRLLAGGARLDIHGTAMLYDLDALRAEIARVGVDVADERGRTPLQHMAWSGMWKLPHVGSEGALACLDLLLAAGADINLYERMMEGDEVFAATALWRAVSWQEHVALVRALLAAGADPTSSVFGAGFGANEQILEALHAHGADWNWKLNGRTPLLDLLHWRKPAAVPWLLEHGADVAATDGEGRTALHLGALAGVKVDYLETLIAHGADPATCDHAGHTALDLARQKRRGKAVAYLESF